jgi:hypothetical protein
MRGDPAVEVERTARLDPEFDSQTEDYDVIVPHDNSGVSVKVTATERDAKVTINNTRIDRGEKTILPPTAIIEVEHGTSSMTYTLTITEGSDDTPTFTAMVDDLTFPIGDRISPVELPDATGGNGAITYSLGDMQQDIIPDGLAFNASTRMLTGRPRLRDDAYRTVYQMVYMAMDEDGSSTTDEFLITICDPDSEFITGDCEATGGTTPTANPGFTPMSLSVVPSGNSATLTWTPGDDADMQLIAAVDLAASNLIASIMSMEVGGDVSTHTFSGLTDGGMYAYVVIGFDADGNYKDADGMGYWDVER